MNVSARAALESNETEEIFWITIGELDVLRYEIGRDEANTVSQRKLKGCFKQFFEKKGGGCGESGVVSSHLSAVFA
jgi:hypothetical protein